MGVGPWSDDSGLWPLAHRDARRNVTVTNRCPPEDRPLARRATTLYTYLTFDIYP
ncbi:Uncharacterised protein [Mycobacteroides abscessus subsp. massiliense]|nr:Uncharacterised protein [Mycobacteroides abscessus subsp. massiliense]SKP22046.1 Uncharacterised protein [Mycobacteroides abscessus subsp. massiliense]SKV96385.1 Uncharacterised protein [Mycobacteroides abscessus subsp. massiliense]SKW98401.1 Uncharacterised protein [Mycobacteroides abscessus subsp. massiliense]